MPSIMLRLQQVQRIDYEFLALSQGYPLLHLLFIRPYLWPCAYGNPELRQTLGIEQCEFWDQESYDRRHGT
jgi:hypothetical protein